MSPIFVFWNRLPVKLGVSISRLIGWLMERSFTRLFISPYCRWNGITAEETSRFAPPNESKAYTSFASFFIRQLSDADPKGCAPLSPCDGRLVDFCVGPVKDFSEIKNEWVKVPEIFFPRHGPLLKSETFLNIFLSNANYHRVHSPVDGIIRRITEIPGKLVVLRSWNYGREPSYPAMTNSRINLEIEQPDGAIWYLSLIAGPGVASIKIEKSVVPGSSILVGQEMAHFKIGSTVCLIAPVRFGDVDLNNLVQRGVRANYPLINEK